MDTFTQWFCLAGLLWLFTSAAAIHSRTSGSSLVVDVQNNDKVNAMFVVSTEGSHKYAIQNGIILNATQQGFKVKSVSNEHLVSMQVLKDGKSQFIKILDTGFMQFQRNDYVVPHHLLAEAQNVFETKDIQAFTNKVLKRFAFMQSAERGFKTALHQLSSKPESRLIFQASEALGNEGITGVSHPLMLPLYVFATRLPHARRHQQQQHFPEELAEQRYCRKPSRKNKCFGMCGYDCRCWKFVCGDCCKHKGCEEHDVCCRKEYFSSYCLLPFNYGFTCNRFRGFPACKKKLKSKSWWGK